MGALAVVDAVGRVAEGTHGGFVYASLACVAAVWLLYRGTVQRIGRLEAELAQCNRRHLETDWVLAVAGQRAECLGRSITALWTILHLGACGEVEVARRVRLPPLHELLEGKVVVEVREASA